MTKKTVAEQIADLENTRAAKMARIEEVMSKSLEEGRTTDEAEAEETDTLTAEIEAIDKDLNRLRILEKIQIGKATPVAGQSIEDASKARGPLPNTIQIKENTDPGIAFARFARVKALSQLGQGSPIDLARSLYPNDAKLNQAIAKTAVPAANTNNANWAGNLINDGGVPFADFVEYLRPRTLLGQIEGRLRRIPFNTPVAIQTTGGTAKWTKEGTAKPLTQWTYNRTKLEQLKVTAIAAATKETLFRSSISVDALIRDELVRSIAAAIDVTFFSTAAAVSDTSPAGILNGTSPLILSGTGDSDGVRCDAQTLMRNFSENNLSLQGAVWIMNESTATALALMQNPLGQTAFPGMEFSGGTFLGLPAFVSNYAVRDSQGSQIALIKADDIFFGDEGGVEVSVSEQASLLMDDAPSMDSTTPTGSNAMVSMWQTNSVAFRVERYLNWQKRRSQAVAWGVVNWDACA